MEDSNFRLEIEMDRYLDEEMPEVERHAFEQRVKEDPDLEKTLEAHKRARLFVHVVGYDEAKAEMADIWEEAQQKLNEPKLIPLFKRYGSYMIVAAAVIALLILVSIFLSGNESPNVTVYKNLLAEKDTKLGLILKMGTTERDKIYLDASKAYRNNNYEKTLSLLKQLPQASQQSDTVLFITGDAYLKTLQSKDAIPYFKQILERKKAKQIIKEKTEWNLVLAYILNDEVTRAQEQLNQIRDTPGHTYQKAAIKGLKEIEENLHNP